MLRKLSIKDHLFISCLWLAYNFQWGALLPIVLPHQIASIAGPHHKEFFNGVIGPAGAVVALIVAPLAGAVSDRSTHRLGRRRPHLIIGIVINALGLLFMAFFREGGSIWIFFLTFLFVQSGCNWWGGPYAGLIPDVVPENQRGIASGFMMLMTAVGFTGGALTAGQLLRLGSYLPAYGVIIIVMLGLLIVTLMGVREQPRVATPDPFRFKRLIRSFFLSPRKHADFYWVLVTRAFVGMGTFSLLTFLQYFLDDVIGVANAVQKASTLVVVIIVAGIPAGIIAGPLSDRYGRKAIVSTSSFIMALATLSYVGVALHRSWLFTILVAVIFGIGNGAYQVVDWALAIDVLPTKEDAGKDMGIWHVSIVLPQVLGPAMTGTLLDWLKSISLLMGYQVTFIMTGIWLLLGAAFVRRIKGIR